MELDVVWLARLQFALTIGFHYLFPPLTIGLSALMIISEGLFLATRNHEYEGMARFWTRLFALTFAMGVATGIVMEFQFGTNWATYSRFVGDVFGAALAAEGIFAFFLESGFLAVVVFGWNKVSPLKHFLATVMVGLGATFSAVWIIVANSWQQTPTGYHVVTTEAGRRAELTDFWTAVLNPSTLDRLVHTLIGAMIMGGFFVLSISAFYLLRGRHEDFAKRSFAIALPFTAFFSLAAAISGHSNAKMVARYQPGKLAAFEGQFDTAPRAPLHLWGWVDEEAQRVRGGLAVPGLLSFLVHGDTAAPIAGLNDPNTVPGGLPAGEAVRDYWPPVNLSFQLYHLMVGLGVAFIVLTVTAMLLLWRGTLFRKRWLLRAFMFAVIGPVIANQAGWAAAEVGRQPWVVWGLLKTKDAVSRSVPGEHILGSMVMFGLIYALLLVLWLHLLDMKIRQGPDSPQKLATAARARGGWLSASATRSASSPESPAGSRGGSSGNEPTEDG